MLLEWKRGNEHNPVSMDILMVWKISPIFKNSFIDELLTYNMDIPEEHCALQNKLD